MSIVERKYAGHWLVFALLSAILGGYLAWDMHRDYQRVRTEQIELLVNRTRLVEQNLSRQLLATDRSLNALRADLPLFRAQPDTINFINRRLRAISEAIPGIRSMVVVNADGLAIASNRSEWIGQNFRDGERYRMMSQDPNPDKLFIAPPFVSPLGSHVIGLGKVLLDDQGRFGGYMLAVVAPDYFSTLLDSTLFTADMRSALVHGEGKVIYRNPDGEKLAGSDVAKPGSFFHQHMQSGEPQTIIDGRSSVTGDDRVAVLRTLNEPAVRASHSMVIALSRDRSAIFASWWHELHLRAGLFGLLLVGGSLGLLFHHSRLRNLDLVASQQELKRQQAQEALRQSEEYLATTLRSIGDAVIVTDAAGNITQINPAAERLTGWPLGEAKGTPLQDVFHIVNADTFEPVANPVARAMESGEVVGLANHTTLIARNGREYQIADSAAPIRNARGEIRGVVLVFSDVTEQYRVIKALRESEALLKTVTDRSKLGMVLVSREHRYVYANAAYASVMGLGRTDIVGKRVGDVWPDAYESQIKPRLEQAFAGHGVTYDFVVPPRGGEGEDRVYAVVMEPAVDTQFGPCVIALVSDVTERHRSEALRARLAAAVESSNDAIFVRDREHRIVYWNKSAERLYGFTAAEVLGKVDTYHIAPAEAEIRQTYWEKLLHGEAVENFHAIRGRKDGSKLHVSIGASPVRDAEGHIVGIVTIARDISEQVYAALELRENQAKLRAALEAMNDAVFISDKDGRLIEFNEAFAMFHRFKSRKEFAESLEEYTAFLELCSAAGDVLPPEQWAVPRALRGESTNTAEFHLRRKDTGETWIGNYTYAPIRGENGTIVGAVVTARDVTDIKRAEEARARLAAIIEQSQDAIISRKLDGEILTWNAGAERIFGYSAAEAIGRNIAFTMEPGRRSKTAENNEAVLRKGVLIRETRRRTREGRIITVRGSYSALRDGDGRTVGISQILQDITELKNIESARARLAYIIENSHDAIISRDLNGAILSWNAGAERIFGYRAQEVLGKHIEQILPTDSPSNVDSNNAAVLRSEAFFRETNRTTKDGSRITVRGSYSPLRDDAGTIVGVSLIMQEITALKEAEAARATLEAQLREAQKMEAIGTLAGGIAHDFNNIIAGIMGNADLAREDARGNPALLESIGEINKATRRARDLVQQILSFSRRQPTERNHVSLEPIVRETVRLLHSTLPRRISIDIQCAADVPAVIADATQIQQALINLATNAFHALPDARGRIRFVLDSITPDSQLAAAHPKLAELHARHPGPAVRITVSDTGTGMDAPTMARIFDPFFTTKPKNQGTGLGLSVVHGIVQSHEGVIVVDSTPGAGSTFSLYLPAAPTQPALPRDEPMAEPAPITPIGNGHRILYIDDDDVLVSMVARLMERHGFTVRSHSNQRRALEELRTDPTGFDIVLTDYNMPDMSGVDVALAVRAISKTIPIVVTSGFIDDTLLLKAKDAGVSEVISKTDSAEELCAVVQRVIQRYKAQAPD